MTRPWAKIVAHYEDDFPHDSESIQAVGRSAKYIAGNSLASGQFLGLQCMISASLRIPVTYPDTTVRTCGCLLSIMAVSSSGASTR